MGSTPLRTCVGIRARPSSSPTPTAGPTPCSREPLSCHRWPWSAMTRPLPSSWRSFAPFAGRTIPTGSTTESRWWPRHGWSPGYESRAYTAWTERSTPDRPESGCAQPVLISGQSPADLGHRRVGGGRAVGEHHCRHGLVATVDAHDVLGRPWMPLYVDLAIGDPVEVQGVLEPTAVATPWRAEHGDGAGRGKSGGREHTRSPQSRCWSTPSTATCRQTFPPGVDVTPPSERIWGDVSCTRANRQHPDS